MWGPHFFGRRYWGPRYWGSISGVASGAISEWIVRHRRRRRT